jgi:hypothetical protein
MPATRSQIRAGTRQPRRRLRSPAIVLVLALLGAGPAVADSMRCGNRIVKDGDPIEKVLDVCGEPVKKERTWIQRPPQYELGDRYYSFPGREDVPVDLWTYDFGRNKLMRRVRFVDGLIVSIVELGKGT